jgi:hypothetical protein
LTDFQTFLGYFNIFFCYRIYNHYGCKRYRYIIVQFKNIYCSLHHTWAPDFFQGGQPFQGEGGKIRRPHFLKTIIFKKKIEQKIEKKIELYTLAECYATLRVFTEKNSKKIPQKNFSKKKFQKKIPKIKKLFCLNSYACHRGSACKNLGGLGLLV